MAWNAGRLGQRVDGVKRASVTSVTSVTGASGEIEKGKGTRAGESQSGD